MPAYQGFQRLLIANRGEVAARIARTCNQMGITPVFAISSADQQAPYVKGREVVLLGPADASKSYLDRMRMIQAAKEMRCSALHPGWGFLAEDAVFASLCETHGITFLGPPAQVIDRFGKKTPAKRAMKRAGLRVIPGSEGPLKDSAEAEALAREIGYPLLLKAESGGGGRGMRLVEQAAELEGAFDACQREAEACFGDARVYAEKFLNGGRHIEVQVLADRYGNAVHLGERDCTVQRNHQKLLEEAPAIILSDAQRAELLDASVRATAAIGYVGAGTLEFLLSPEGELFFMEMNTRLQVEHPVSELRTDIDLVEAQIRIAGGERLWLSQQEICHQGHVIECRINAEDPSQDFRPSPGVITKWAPPQEVAGELRIDTHVEESYEVPPFYDSLVCKLLVRGHTRDDAIQRMLQALDAFQVEGITTTQELHRAVLSSDAFQQNDYDVSTIPGWKS